MRRVEAACTARAAGLRRVPAVRTRRAFLTSFPARRLVEQDFVRTVDAIVPPRAHKPGFKRLTAAAERRVDAADALNEAVLTRDVGAARAALSKSRSSSVVIEREAHTFGASCTA